MVTPGPPPPAPPASHPLPPTDTALWHMGLILPSMSLTQHPHSEPTRTSPPPSSRCSAWSPSLSCRLRASVHLRSRTSPVLPGITPSEISVCVRPQDTTLWESEKRSHFLSFPRILQICLKVLLNLEIYQVLYRRACNAEYTRRVASPALCIIRQLQAPPHP